MVFKLKEKKYNKNQMEVDDFFRQEEGLESDTETAVENAVETKIKFDPEEAEELIKKFNAALEVLTEGYKDNPLIIRCIAQINFYSEVNTIDILRKDVETYYKTSTLPTLAELEKLINNLN